MQVGFINSICMPVYEAFAKMSDRLNPMLEGCKQNKAQWTDLADRDLDPWKNNARAEDDLEEKNNQKK